jgi:hypothetical protein
MCDESREHDKKRTQKGLMNQKWEDETSHVLPLPFSKVLGCGLGEYIYCAVSATPLCSCRENLPFCQDKTHRKNDYVFAPVRKLSRGTLVVWCESLAVSGNWKRKESCVDTRQGILKTSRTTLTCCCDCLRCRNAKNTQTCWWGWTTPKTSPFSVPWRCTKLREERPLKWCLDVFMRRRA